MATTPDVQGGLVPRAVLSAAPGVALGLAGLFHPHRLTADSADRWFTLHLLGVVAFPLVGVALALLVAGRRDPLAWAVKVAAYGYATFYTALDVVYGVAGGWLVREAGPGAARPPALNTLLPLADGLGQVGSWSLLVATLLVVVDVVRRVGAIGGLTVVLLPGAWLVHTDHIFAPQGVLGMALLGVGTAAAVWVGDGRPSTAKAPTPVG